ncbi:phytanoyl-CoA dioxygenase [Aureococcus anophagefferens]|nr:phytanoyl-CoA dioxygenase [Aureococcus anophagefferens]
MARGCFAACTIALAAGATHTQTIAIDGLVVDATWETGTDPNLIWAPVDAFLEIPADEPTRRLAAAHFCDEAKWEDDACEATVAAALAAAAAAGERFQVAHFGSFPLERVSEDHWGNPLDYDGDAALTAAFRRGTDFASRCAPRRAADTPAVRVAVVATGELRLLDAAHLAKFQRDLAGTTVFVATHARFEAAARDLTAPERIVAADPAILEAELRARGVAQVARSRATYAPGEAAQAARDAEHNNTEVHGGFWQWALLDLALDAFWEDLAAFDVVVRTRADLDEHVPFPYADLRAAPGAIHCRSDFVFYGGPAEFSRAFDGARTGRRRRSGRAPDGSPLYEPVDWDLVLASDLTGLKWWWLPLPVAVFGAGGAGPGVDAPPRTPVELKSAARDHLDALRRLPRARRRAAPATTRAADGLHRSATELSTRRFPYVRDATDDSDVAGRIPARAARRPYHREAAPVDAAIDGAAADAERLVSPTGAIVDVCDAENAMAWPARCGHGVAAAVLRALLDANASAPPDVVAGEAAPDAGDAAGLRAALATDGYAVVRRAATPAAVANITADLWDFLEARRRADRPASLRRISEPRARSGSRASRTRTRSASPGSMMRLAGLVLVVLVGVRGDPAPPDAAARWWRKMNGSAPVRRGASRLSLTMDGRPMLLRINGSDLGELATLPRRVCDEFLGVGVAQEEGCRTALLAATRNVRLLEYYEAAMGLERHLRSRGVDFDVLEGHTGTYHEKVAVLQRVLDGAPANPTVCEIGFNAGHSALNWLAARPDSRVFAFDHMARLADPSWNRVVVDDLGDDHEFQRVITAAWDAAREAGLLAEHERVHAQHRRCVLPPVRRCAPRLSDEFCGCALARPANAHEICCPAFCLASGDEPDDAESLLALGTKAANWTEVIAHAPNSDIDGDNRMIEAENWALCPEAAEEHLGEVHNRRSMIAANFEALVANYRGVEARVSYVHGAVVETPGPATFYDLRRCGEAENDDDMEAATSAWRITTPSLFASTNRTFVGWHVGFIRNGTAPIVRRTVPGFDWATLLTTHGGDAVGLLLLDVESMDCDLLLRFPFDDVRPDVVAPGFLGDARNDACYVRTGPLAVARPFASRSSAAV